MALRTPSGSFDSAPICFVAQVTFRRCAQDDSHQPHCTPQENLSPLNIVPAARGAKAGSLLASIPFHQGMAQASRRGRSKSHPCPLAISATKETAQPRTVRPGAQPTLNAPQAYVLMTADSC